MQKKIFVWICIFTAKQSMKSITFSLVPHITCVCVFLSIENAIDACESLIIFFADVFIVRRLILSNLLVKTVNFVVYIQWITHNSKWLFTILLSLFVSQFSVIRKSESKILSFDNLFVYFYDGRLFFSDLLLQFGRTDESKRVQQMKNEW